MTESSDIVTKLYARFELEVLDIVRRESANYRLVESGQPRVNIRTIVIGIAKTAQGQVDSLNQVKLYETFGIDFASVQEYDLALECFDMALNCCDSIPNEMQSTKHRVEVIHNIIKSNLAILNDAKVCRIAPMCVSKLLISLQQLRKTLESIFALPVRSQEELAWQVLNSCKLIMEIGQPLVWHSCGKYVLDTMMFAGLSMESIINLCTVRHMTLRMKIYSTGFCAALAQNSVDEAAGVLEHTTRQVLELRQREEIDPPVPEASLRCFDECESDLAVMRIVLDFWRDPDSLDVSAAHLLSRYPSAAQMLAPLTLSDRALAECIRVHLLTSGNVNEPYRKRSACILKSMVKVVTPYKVQVLSPDSGALREVDPANLPIAQLFSAQTLFEVTSVAVFEATEGVDVGELLTKLWSLYSDVSVLSESGMAREDIELRAAFDLLHTTTEIVGIDQPFAPHKNGECLALMASFIVRLEEVVYSSVAYRRKALVKKVSLYVWMKFLYPGVQRAMSAFESEGAVGILQLITPAICTVAKVLDLVGLEDAVTLGSMALLAANLLWISGDQRGGIAILRQAISCIEEHRAARLDFVMHSPEDVRDVLALQRASFTTRADEQDWFHSVKRLGAHAFAGYGIFGLSSSADRSDCAVAEIHTELVALYFRYELQHAVQAETQRSKIRHSTALNDKEKEKTLAATAKMPIKTLKKTATVSKTSATYRPTLSAKGEGDVNGDKIHVVSALRAFCSKNGYFKCLLLLEMARIDSDELRRREYLRVAQLSVEDCEAQEQLLKDSFRPLLVMTNTAMVHPLVIARSNRYLYVAPVGCRKQHNKISYYRVFAKEKGSGTDVSVYNDDIAGCEHKVTVQNLKTLKESVVRIGPLRGGEVYMVGAMGFSQDDKPYGAMSPTSPVVEAVNPLPTILLWALLNQTAAEVCSLPRLNRSFSMTVCDRFFLTTPTVNPLVIGKGTNMFLFSEPALCMLALQQSSPLLLVSFINAFIVYEKNAVISALQHKNSSVDSEKTTSVATHWIKRRPWQLAKLESLHRTALVAKIACCLSHHDLTLQCVKMGYTMCVDLVRFDMVHLAYLLQSPLTGLVLALQSIRKHNWRSLEHKLYSRLLAFLVKVATLNRNLTPVISVLNTFYPESLDKKLSASALPPGDLMHLYNALARVVKQHISPVHLSPMLLQMGALHVEMTSDEHAKYTAATNIERVGFLWRMSASQRILRVSGTATEFVSVVAEKAVASPDKLQLETWILNDRPESMSDYLHLILHMGRELVNTPSSAERPSVLWNKLLSKIPIFAEYVTADVRAIHDECGLNVLQPIASLAIRPSSSRSAPVATKKPAKIDPKAPVVEVVPPEDPFKVPTRFLIASMEESQNQMVTLAEIILLTATTCYSELSQIDCFPRSTVGPDMRIDLQFHTADSDNHVSSPFGVVPSAGTGGLFSEALSRLDFVRYLGAAMELFIRGGAHSSAVLVASHLWKLICCEWKDPLDFRTEFAPLRSTVHRILTSLVTLLEAISFIEVNVGVVLETAIETPGTAAVTNGMDCDINDDRLNFQEMASMGDKSGLTRREVVENMVIVRDLASYLVKVDWLWGAHAEVVRLGSTLFQMYSINCPEYCKSLGDHCLPLVLNSQEMLVSAARTKLADCQKELDEFVFQYDEAQKRKRKKKLRIARTDKNEEELLFDAECTARQVAIDETQAIFDACLQALEVVNTQQKQFDTLYSTGTQLLDKVKQASARLVKDLRSQYGTSFDLRTVMNEAVQDRLDVTLYQFNQVVSFLREKKERLVLLDALREQGDLLLLFGRLDQVRQVWHDAVDGLFNTIDSCQSWPTVCDKALRSLEPNLVVGVLPVVVVLSKLSRFCASGDLDAKAGYCRMAAELCRIPFQESYGHPQTLVGFAAYVCLDLGGMYSLGVNPEALDARSFALSLEEVVTVLIAEKQFLAALPVVVLWEYFCSSFLQSASQWLNARLTRVKILINCQHFAEAVSMLAGIKSTVHGIHGQTFADPLRVRSARDTQILTAFETSLNALDFFGLAPFLNNFPPDDPANIKSMEWVRALPVDFEGFAQGFVLRLPEKILTAEERAAAEEAAAKAAAEAAELAKKAKGKAAKPGAIVQESTHATGAPMFSPLQLADFTATCGQLLLAIGSLDRQATANQSASLVAVGTFGVELIIKAISALFLCADAVSIKSAAWIGLYGKCQLLLCEYKVLKRKHREALADVLKFVSFLKSGVFSILNGDSKFALCQHWFAASLLLADIADRQGRFLDSVTLSTQGATEASMLYSGFWLRALLLLRARVQYKLGEFEKSLQSIDACIGQYQMNSLQDLSLVRCLTLKAAVLREKRIYADKQLAAAAFTDSIDSLRSAKGIVDALSETNGAFPADSNVVFGRGESAVSVHHRIAPILHNLTTLHSNEPELTLAATIDTKRVNSLAIPKSPTKGHTAPQLTLSSEKDSTGDTNATLRLGPVDSSETVYSASEFCNIYLAETRTTLAVYTALCSLLDDFRSSGACTLSSTGELEVLDEQELLAESALKLMRQSIFVSPLNRVTLLSLTGKIRVAKAAKHASMRDGERFIDTIFGPFRAALQVGVASSAHPWELIRLVCVQLVEAHGDPLLDLGEVENEVRMRTAMVYFVAGVKAGKQLRALKHNTIELTDDPVFASASLSDQLLTIVVNCSSSSATLPRTKPVAEVPVVPTKGSAPVKATKGAPVVAVPPPGPSGRDALFLLNSMLRECDPLWLDGTEQDVCADMHGLLKKAYSLYGSKCSFEAPPDPRTPASVAPNSVSALWTPTRTPADFAALQSRAANSLDYGQIGWYSHVAVFFLLGDRRAAVVTPVVPVVPPKGTKVDVNAVPPVPVASADPVLTRVVLSRVDVTYLEQRLRDIRARFMDATVKKFPKLLYQCNEEFGRTLCMLVGLLMSGMIVEADSGSNEATQRSRASTATEGQRYSYHLAENGAGQGGYLLTLKLPSAKPPQIASLQLTVNEQLMQNLADILSADKDTDCLLDGEVCGLLRSSLGYHVQHSL